MRRETGRAGAAGLLLLAALALGGDDPTPPPGATVAGTIAFGPDARPFREAILNVTILDTTAQGLADPPVLARRTARGVAWGGPDAKPLRFVVRNIVGARPDAVYTLRVHLDLDADGRPEANAGDYESKTAVRVLTGPGPASVTVPVRRVEPTR